MLHRETYRTADRDRLAAYDAAMAGFQRSQGLPDVGWTSSVLSRLATAQALNGRDRLREAIANLGFGLR